MIAAAAALRALGPRAVLVKGGHPAVVRASTCSTTAASRWSWRRAALATANTHGTGCTLSAAIAALLARGCRYEPPSRAAKAYLTAAIEAADQLQVGSGHGPVHHFHALWARRDPSR